MGSTGTYAYLTGDERRRAIEVALNVMDSDIPVIVGVGAVRTDEAAALAADARPPERAEFSSLRFLINRFSAMKC